MTVIKAPEPINLNLDKNLKTIFLSGSIEMGTAEKWQDKVCRELSYKFNILNPRRDNFDDKVKQEITDPILFQQMEWEYEGLITSDAIIVYFDPNTQSPITLLEFGLFIRKNIFLCCPEGFYRKGNVDFIANKYNIKTFKTLDDVILKLKTEELRNKMFGIWEYNK